MLLLPLSITHNFFGDEASDFLISAWKRRETIRCGKPMARRSRGSVLDCGEAPPLSQPNTPPGYSPARELVWLQRDEPMGAGNALGNS